MIAIPNSQRKGISDKTTGWKYFALRQERRSKYFKDLSNLFYFDDNQKEKLKARKEFLNWYTEIRKMTVNDERYL